MLYKIGALKNLAKVLEKTPVLESLFIKGLGLGTPAQVLLYQLKKFKKTTFLNNTSGQLLH